jgi:hypothetical protein
MSAIAETIAKYGALGVAAAFVPAFVHGAMAGAVGLSSHPVSATIQLIAYMAIVAYWTRQNVVDGLLAGLGLVSGIVVISQVRDLVMQGLVFGLGAIIHAIVDYIIAGFLFGLATGLLLGLSPVSLLASVAGFIIGAVIMLLVRVGNLLIDALELGISALFKSLTMGYAALVAPFIGGIFVGIPLGVMLLVFGFALAMALGFAIGLAIAAIILLGSLFFLMPVALMSLILYMGFLTAAIVIFKTFRRSTDVMELVLDLAAIFIFRFLGPALYAAGYAGLLTRYKARSLYLIALGALGS